MGRSKFNVDKSEKGKLNRTYKGVIYDSEMEMKYVIEVLEPMLKSGEIIKFERQVQYELLPAFDYKEQHYASVNYKSDFNIYYKDGSIFVVDIKGLSKPLDVVKKKMLLSRYPDINFSWIVKSVIDGGWCDYEVVKKARAKRKRAKEKT